MDKHCVKCGCKLDKTNWGRYFCKNCGMLEENQDTEESKEIPKYAG